MRDKRPVDELSIEELERILAIKKREQRQEKLKRMQRSGRVVAAPAHQAAAPTPEAVLKAANGSTPGPEKIAAVPAPQFEDEPEVELTKDANAERFWRSFVNQSLLLVEVLAVVGLVYLGYQLFQSINKLEKETASAQMLADEQRRAGIPTLAPTPQLQLNQVVLPTGHTILPNGGARFNYDEIPANLLPLVQDQIVQPMISRLPATDETALQLSIPALNVDQTIVQGVDWEALKLGIGQLPNGINPGDESGNLVLAAHNDIYGEFFRHLDQLQAGDEFFVRTKTQIFTYRITGWELYEPTDVHVMETRGGATATLISCYPYQVNNKRIVVFAERVSAS